MWDASKDICSLFLCVRVTVAEICDCVSKIGQDWSGLMTLCLESLHEIDFGTKVSFKLCFRTKVSFKLCFGTKASFKLTFVHV